MMIKQRSIFTVVILSFLYFENIKPVIDYLDTTFGYDATGIVTAVAGTSTKLNAITIDSNGKKVAAGIITINGVQKIFVVRYNVDGTIDTTFGTNGSGTVTTLVGSSPVSNAIALDSSSRIVIAGSTISGGTNNILLARYNTDGSPDLTFGVGGNITKLVGSSVAANSIVIDINNKILISGTAVISGKNNVMVAKFNSNGTSDSTFGSSGVKVITGAQGYSANSIKIDNNAKIVIGGHTTTAAVGSNFLVARFNVNGSNDNSFGNSGIRTTQVPGSSNSVIKSINIDSSGRIIATGFSGNVTDPNFTLARYTVNGNLDTSFGSSSSGIQISNIGSVSQINSSSLQTDGKIVTAGVSDSLFAIARYNINGSLDTTFGNNGVLLTDVQDTSQINSLTLQSDGKAVAAGYSVNSISGQLNATVVRYNKNNIDFVNINTIANGSVINTKIPVIAGIASVPNAHVEILINGISYVIVPTDNAGNWNAGMTSVLPLGTNFIQANLVVGSNILISQKIKVIVQDNTGEDSFFAYSTEPQVTINTSYSPVPFNNIPQTSTWSYNDTKFTCNKSGKYLIEYSAQIGAIGVILPTTLAINVSGMIAINDIEYLGSGSNSNIALKPNNTKILSKSFVKDLNAGDNISFNFAVNISGDNTEFQAGLISNPDLTSVQPCYSLTVARIS